MTALPVILPPGFFPIVKLGDKITIGQTLAQKISKEEEIINILEELSISPSRVKKVLKKNPGESVVEGDIIAVKKSFLGYREDVIISKLSGTILRYERDTGNLVIRTSHGSLTQNLISPVDGEIVMCDNGKITIHTDKNVITGTRASGSSGEGEVFILESSLEKDKEIDMENMLYFLDSRAIGKIVIGGILPRDLLMKAIGMGCVGVIGTRIEENDMVFLNDKKLSNPVIEIEEEMVKNLLKWKGKKIYIDSPSKSIVFLHV